MHEFLKFYYYYLLIGFKIGSTDLTIFAKFVIFKDNYKTIYNWPLVFFNKIKENVYDILETYESNKVKLSNNDIIEPYYLKEKIHYLIPKKSVVNLDQRYCL